MSAKSELLQARDELMAVLDEKLKGMPEWRAFKAIEKSLIVIDGEDLAKRVFPSPLEGTPRRGRSATPSYVKLALEAISAAGKPVPTPEIVAFITERRGLDSTSESIRVSIQSALSKDDRIRSVPWRGGRAWWFEDLEIPRDEAAGQSLRL
jgi:hypothetical protein